MIIFPPDRTAMLARDRFVLLERIGLGHFLGRRTSRRTRRSRRLREARGGHAAPDASVVRQPAGAACGGHRVRHERRAVSAATGAGP